MKKRYIVFITILVLILLLLSTLFMSFSFGSKESKIDYSHVMRDSITNKSALVTDIAMLGAHDAFSSGINMKSGVNSNESGIQTNKFVGMFAKGLIVRMSKSQIADAKTLLKAGVRYFDMRCTKLDNKYYATHGYLSNEIKEYINDIVDFLGEADGEFIVLDIQHFYTENGANNALDKSEYETLLNYLNEYKNAKGFGILDYVRYDSTTDTLATLTYEKVVGDSSGIIILAKTNELKSCYYRDSNALKDGGNYTSIRSYWHQTNKTKDLLSGMDSEASLVKEKGYDGIFVVNQAQKTGFIMNASIMRSLFSWSIIDMANNFNKNLVSDKERFMNWLDSMPILMVDFTTSTKGDFNNLANKYIMEKNKSL